MAERDTYRYQFVKGRKVVWRGITEDLEEREEAHQRTFGGGHIKQIGPKVTEESAREWERKGGKRLPRNR